MTGQNLPQNYIIPSRYQLTFTRLANTVFYLSACVIPSIDLTVNQQPTPFNNLPLAGDRIIWQPLRVNFLMDEQLVAWYAIFNWLMGLGRPIDAQQYADLAENSIVNGVTTYGVRPPYGDATLIQYTNKNNPQNQWQFIDCFPVSLSGIDFDYSKDANEVLICGAEFRYSYYTFSSF